MTPLPALVVAGTFAAAIAFAVILDLVKVPIFRRLADRVAHAANVTRTAQL